MLRNLTSGKACIYFNNTALPGYVPYIYPHPLVIGRKPNADAIAYSDSNPYAESHVAAVANAVPGTFANAHVDSSVHTYCHANSNSTQQQLLGQRRRPKADGYTNQADRKAEAYA